MAPEEGHWGSSSAPMHMITHLPPHKHERGLKFLTSGIDGIHDSQRKGMVPFLIFFSLVSINRNRIRLFNVL